MAAVTRVYGGFRGVDFRGEEISLDRSPDSVNMWRSYRQTESVSTRPGLRLHTAFAQAVRGIYFLNGEMLVHSGDALYAVKDGGCTRLGLELAPANSCAFVYENKLYLLDGSHYLCYDGVNLSQVEGYVPTTSIGRKPEGGGTKLEDVNLLSDYRINTFLGDGESVEFRLDTEDIDGDYCPTVTVDGKAVAVRAVDQAKGTVTLAEAPPAPATDGQDNVVIRFKKHVSGYAGCIGGCTMAQIFDNRVFVSGNPGYPNTVWHCALNDPTYFSDLDYYREGPDPAKVTGLVAGNNALWVFREPSDANTTVFYHTPTLDAEYGKIYPSSHSGVTAGCVGKAINFHDDIVFFSSRGMEGISGDITTEQVLAHRSSLVDRKLLAEAGYRQMLLEEWEGYLLVIMGKSVYLADSRAVFTNEGHREYEFFYWQLEKAVTAARTHGGVLYLGTADGVYTLDGEEAVPSWWTTPLDKFRYPNRLKTALRRGCVAEVCGEQLQIFGKSDQDGDWTVMGSFPRVEDALVCAVPKKRFKDLRLKFFSPKRFRLETVTVEVLVGGYMKRV